MAVGAVIPHRETLRPLPATIIHVVPEYRGFVLIETPVDDVSVDPVSLEIVDVIPL